MTRGYHINDSSGGRGFSPDVERLEMWALAPEESLARSRSLVMRWLGFVHSRRFHAAVIPNPRAFCGVRDLLFACSLSSGEDVKRAGWLLI